MSIAQNPFADLRRYQPFRAPRQLPFNALIRTLPGFDGARQHDPQATNASPHALGANCMTRALPAHATVRLVHKFQCRNPGV
ncbi:MAG: hypothetical protein EWM45_01480 [Rhodopseudomonas palustris]|nr:MAG: hypothetical protein EWM45_01480 [Rhodopseudomonas palustris]